jgi:ATP-dependent protease HslVU (ClpYQ) peptidase subunit
MGADSAASDDRVTVIMFDSKVKDFGTGLVGYAGSIKAGRSMFKYLDSLSNHDELAMRVEEESSKPIYKGAGFLVIQGSKIHEIEEGSGFQHSANYAAIGSGCEVALGALYVNHADMNGVIDAIEAAATFTPNVKPPAIVLSCPSL